jgi:hypothetical protein
MPSYVTFCDNIRQRILDIHNEEEKCWRTIAQDHFEGIKPGTLCRFATTDYDPKDKEIRKILGLPLITIQYKDPVTGRFIKKE